MIRGRLTGALRPSTTERSEPSVRTLALARGQETLIFELQGYVFFGTAHALFSQLRARHRAAGDDDLQRDRLDFRRAQGLDVSAVFNLRQARADCRPQGWAL